MSGDTEILVRGGHVVDPKNGIDAPLDLVLKHGKVDAVAEAGSLAARGKVIDARGRYVFPGVIDLHVHLASRYSGAVAQKMLARAGVTTALDMGSAPEDALATAAAYGAGITVGSLCGMVPGGNIPGRDASRPAIRQALNQCLDGGSLGIKIHFDNKLTPAATAISIEEANRLRAWVAFHCGTTETASDITGLREAVLLAGENRLHLAHVNSYCRGNVMDPVAEAQEAVSLLTGAPHLFSESYLAVINGTSALCANGVPVIERVAMWLGMGGFAPTEDGLRDAILAGWARINKVDGDDTVLATGEDGVAAWRAAGTNIGLSFPVNPPVPRLMLAVARTASGNFVVDALGTDGGGIPRNVLLQDGLLLVALEMLSVSDLVRKLAWTPARVIGLLGKGHLTPGTADADVTVVDPVHRRAVTTIAGGRIVMHEGVVLGEGTTFLTTERGRAAVEAAGCTPSVIDLARSGFYTGDGLKA